MSKSYLLCTECGKHFLSGSGIYCPDDEKPLVLIGKAEFGTERYATLLSDDEYIPPKIVPATPRQKLEQRFMQAAIPFFESGEKLYRLLHTLIVLQLIIAIMIFIVSCLSISTSIGIIGSILRAITKSIQPGQ